MTEKYFKWDPKQLRALVDEKGTSRSKLAYAMGLHPAKFKAYDEGIVTPTQKDLVTMADFFGVSVDFLLNGPEKTEPENKDDEAVKETERPVSDKSDAKPMKVEKINIPKGYVAAWPYNLIDAVLGDIYEKEPYDGIVTSDQREALNYVIETRLDDKQRDMLLAHYRDRETLESIGKRYSLSRERVRQIIADTTRFLRHPSNKRMISAGLYGSKILEREDMLKAREMALEVRKKLLEEAESLVSAREARLLAKLPQKIEEIRAFKALFDKDIVELELSHRSENGLRRKGINTIQDILDYMDSKDLMNINNLGQKSVNEIKEKVKLYCDIYNAMDKNIKTV